jgi:hypothetical protein
LLARLAAAVGEEYEAVRAEAHAAVEGDGGTRRLVERLRRELHRIEARDHASPQAHERARRAVEQLATTFDVAAAKVPR